MKKRGADNPVPLELQRVTLVGNPAQNSAVIDPRSSTVCAACVIVVVPDGVEKIHPPTDTISFTFKPKMVSGVRVGGEKVVAAVVCTVILKGAQVGGVLAVAMGCTKSIGRVLRVKLSALALIAATDPVI